MIWKKIKDTDIEISDKGLLRNIKTKKLNRIFNIKQGLQVVLYYGSEKKSKMVHVLMAEAFLKNHVVEHEIIHINGNVFDNNLTNLRSQKRTWRKIRKHPKKYINKKGDKTWLNNILELEKKNVKNLFKN